MKIESWNSLQSWVASVGPNESALTQEYITGLKSKDLDHWRKRVAKFSPTCVYSGLILSIEPEKRGGLILKVVTPEVGQLSLLISKDKVEEIRKATQLVQAGKSIVASFKAYLHFEYGFIGLVTMCNEAALSTMNMVTVNPKVMPRTATVQCKKGEQKESKWTAEKDKQLFDMLERDIGIRTIAVELDAKPREITSHMLRLDIINPEQYTQINDQLKALGF
ncbi:hypothetical protein F7Q91_02975 [Vibrio chagasii]|uniref:Uncharacterized protein n=1 Tax=Vibrio chagasii TaxID=170679 RepID=A0A7V7THX9_9VIBR|nr:hypothetical protein [Vibrio chagasii]KAB0482384.1 hypothetical protein F7Q91_02975 [Vibrio chagasii]